MVVLGRTDPPTTLTVTMTAKGGTGGKHQQSR
jgi:hypothetical protein